MVEYRHMTVNGAVNYAYDDRYVATFSFAADGSDNYRPGNRWGFYPSLGLGWIVSRERFLRDSRMVDLLKLRASVGKNGWDPMGEMRYLWEGYYTDRGGLNTGTYQKSLVDYEGQPKLAWYTHQMAFQNVLACSGNVDMVYGPDDRLPLIVMNLGGKKTVDVRVQLFSRDGGTLYEREYRNVCLPEGRSCTSVDELKLPETEGICSIVYTVLEKGEQ